MAENPSKSAELTQIGRDAAAHVGNSDVQVANRLQLEVGNYLHEHHSAKDVADLTKQLKIAGLQNEEIGKLEKMGFPSPIVDQHPTPLNQPSEATTGRGDTPWKSARDRGAPGTGSDAQAGGNKSFRDVMDEVNQAEGSYNRTSNENNQGRAESSLRAALSDVRKYCHDHPDEAADMIRKLDENKLLPQLSVLALNDAVKQQEATTGKPVGSLTRQDALNLLGHDNSELGKALSASMNRSFSRVQADGTVPEGYRGEGYADAARTASGHDINSPANSKQGDQPLLTEEHLHGLMSHFDRELLPPNQEVSLDRDQPSLLTRIIRSLP